MAGEQRRERTGEENGERAGPGISGKVEGSEAKTPFPMMPRTPCFFSFKLHFSAEEKSADVFLTKRSFAMFYELQSNNAKWGKVLGSLVQKSGKKANMICLAIYFSVLARTLY